MEQIDTTLIASFKLLIQTLVLFLDTVCVQFLTLRYQHFLIFETIYFNYDILWKIKYKWFLLFRRIFASKHLF